MVPHTAPEGWQCWIVRTVLHSVIHTTSQKPGAVHCVTAKIAGEGAM
jgi:hypothetical protein